MRNRPPALIQVEVLRMAGSVIGQIQAEVPEGYHLDLVEHPSGKVWGLFAEVAIHEAGQGSMFYLQVVGTFDRGTGRWKKLSQAEMLDHLTLMHSQALWSVATAAVRQMAAICNTSVEIPGPCPDPTIPDLTTTSEVSEDDAAL